MQLIRESKNSGTVQLIEKTYLDILQKIMLHLRYSQYKSNVKLLLCQDICQVQLCQVQNFLQLFSLIRYKESYINNKSIKIVDMQSFHTFKIFKLIFTKIGGLIIISVFRKNIARICVGSFRNNTVSDLKENVCQFCRFQVSFIRMVCF